MVNNYSKMRRNQKRVRDYLEKKGWLVFLIQHSRFQKDIFNLFDGFAVKKGVVMFIQIKSNKKPNIKPFRKFNKKYNIPYKIYVVKDRIKEIKEYI